MKLAKYVMQNAIRGTCTCGRCSDAPRKPEQPKGHTVNLTFFEVSNKGGEKDKFLELVKQEYPHWLNGKEHGYIQVGGEMGDQGLALLTIGLGGVLGAWDAISPDTLMSFLDKDLKHEMAGRGMVSLQHREME